MPVIRIIIKLLVSVLAIRFILRRKPKLGPIKLPSNVSATVRRTARSGTRGVAWAGVAGKLLPKRLLTLIGGPRAIRRLIFRVFLTWLGGRRGAPWGLAKLIFSVFAILILLLGLAAIVILLIVWLFRAIW